MRPRSFAALALAVVCAGLSVAIRDRERPQAAPEAAKRTPPLLPGPRPDGSVQLPNQWSLRPAGRQFPLGDFPVNAVLHPDGKFLAVLHAGYGEHEIVILSLDRGRPHVVCRVALEQTFLGLCFAPDGKTLYASGGEFNVIHAFAFEDGLLSRHRQLPVADRAAHFHVGGVAVAADGRTLFACGVFADAVAVVPVDKPAERRTVKLPKSSAPATCLPEPKGGRLFVSLWGGGGVAVVDLTNKDAAPVIWPTASHPTEMVLSPDGKTLYVACSNSTSVSVLSTDNGKELERIECALYPGVPSGNTPGSLTLTPDGELLFVANADANNLAVIRVAEAGKAKPLGFIPVGWYPTAVRYDPVDRRLYVTNGKGLSSKANRDGPGPYAEGRLRPLYQYIAGLLQGSLSVIDVPGPGQLADYTKQAYACSPLRPDAGVTVKRPADSPIPGKAGEPSPIKYVVYVIKENRTYDQVFGDVKEGNGDPSLCLFDEKVTPNHHRLVRDFVLLDNFYVDGEVSADGHQWSMAAYATDYVEKMWPLVYRGSPLKKLGYPSEGTNPVMEQPAGGYIWDRAAEAKVSYRSYGEWVANGPSFFLPARARVKALEGHIDPWFHGFDLDYPDQKRADRFIEELHRFEAAGDMPRLTILRLPSDHTAGTSPGKHTPIAMAADNDLALGRVVEALSKSKFWKETAIFVVEDDAQNGPDHVDCHRSVCLLISPYVRRGHVDSTMYSTSSMLRTMELILGLKPMSQFDAAAAPMYESFQAKADVRPYEHLPAQVDLGARNKADAREEEASKQFDLSREDAVDDLLFNEAIWRSVKGPNVPMPAPKRAAFVTPTVKKDDDD